MRDIKKLNKDDYIKRAEDDETIGHAIYRALNPEDKQAFHTPTEFIHVSWDEVMSIASDEWLPLTDMVARKEDATDYTYNWLEHRYPKNPSLTGFFLSEGADPSPGAAVTPNRYHNTMGESGTAFKMTDQAQIIARRRGLVGVGPDEFARQMAAKMLELRRSFELALLESNEKNDAEPFRFRGLMGNYRSANGGARKQDGWIGLTADGAVEQANVQDLAGVELTVSNIEQVFETYLLTMRELQGGGLATTLFVPPRMMRMLKNARSDKIRITMTQEEVGKMVAFNMGGQVGKFLTSWGLWNIVRHPYLFAASSSGDPNIAESRLLALDPTGLTLVDYVGYGGVHIEPRAKTDSTERRVVKQICTLEVRKLLSQGYMSNFWVDPAS